MTSQNEGTPLILMESMLCGVLVASTPVGGIPYLVEHEKTGYHLTKNLTQDANYLQNKIENFASEKEKIKNSAKLKIETDHSLAKLLTQTIELYNQ